MLPVFMLASFLLSAPPPKEAVPTVAIEIRKTLAFDIVESDRDPFRGEEAAKWSTSLENAIRAQTRLKPTLLANLAQDPAELVPCRASGTLRCWVQLLAHHPAHELRLALVIYVGGSADDRHLQASLLDLGIARSILESSGSGADWEETLEDRLYTDALVARTASFLSVEEAGGLEPLFKRLFELEFQEAFKERNMDAFSTIRLNTGGPDVRVNLDGEGLGGTQGGRLHIIHVPPGLHTLELTGPNCTTAQKRLELQGGQVMDTLITPVCGPEIVESSVEEDSSDLWMWLGIGLGAIAVGATVTAVAVGSGSNEVEWIFN